ncbi:hypothetical protein Jden_1912 [Jonesia denitrificans DSM 20603]|uniref:Uncharacterized protein n=1 Tax=Jonesia denitrificans (strain ATCC 14870 / DSM 20603 / BCRC 15368 / CIP 55.134 / JCM 11481 / NBRC 15587 / NCTC 10816 / Prevot 55134) TaxID=471856 RepID=C7QZZ7_JONDD|nr:hypothetical protein Jden_1912 [Jonesia denitrificans DSM 20603]SQH21969.1 Uncharacterised protein [Jonesia denitrificans]
MYTLTDAPATAFRPRLWLLPHNGTNGQVSQWGALLAGSAPPAVRAVKADLSL